MLAYVIFFVLVLSNKWFAHVFHVLSSHLDSQLKNSLLVFSMTFFCHLMLTDMMATFWLQATEARLHGWLLLGYKSVCFGYVTLCYLATLLPWPLAALLRVPIVSACTRVKASRRQRWKSQHVCTSGCSFLPPQINHVVVLRCVACKFET